MFVRSLLCAAAVLAAVSGNAFAQNRHDPIPAPDLRQQALTYLMQDRFLGNFGGNTDPERILGRAVQCRYNAQTGAYAYIGEPVALTVDPYYEADADRRQRESSWTVQGSVSGQLGATIPGATFNVSGDNSRLTRLTVRELVRLTLRVENPVEGTILTRTHILSLNRLGRVRNIPATDFWCVFDGASLWEISTESFNRQNNAQDAGFWIITSANRKYHRSTEATVYYQILTHARVVYDVPYINELAAALQPPVPPPVLPTPTAPPPNATDIESRITADFSVEALQLGDQTLAPILNEVRQEELQRDLQIQMQSLRELGLSPSEVNRVINSDVLSPRF